jgi:hypothetical protein
LSGVPPRGTREKLNVAGNKIQADVAEKWRGNAGFLQKTREFPAKQPLRDDRTHFFPIFCLIFAFFCHSAMGSLQAAPRPHAAIENEPIGPAPKRPNRNEGAVRNASIRREIRQS